MAVTAGVKHAVRDRAVGALVGLAAGDAVGTTVEFRDRGSFAPLTDMVGGGPFRLKPGQWTDDTSMALCLAESLIAHPALDAEDLMTRFVGWMTRGHNSATGVCFDIGITTSRSIRGFQRDGNPIAGNASGGAAGNGSVMRLAPVAVRWWRDSAELVRVARLQSRTTHGAAEAVDGSELLARVLSAAIGGAGLDALEQDDPAWAPAIRAIGRGRYRDKPERDIRSSGYVVDTLEAAFWVARRADRFETAILAAANLGNDADTVAAVTGQIAGALWGHSAIPAHWRARLHEHDRIADLGGALFEAGAAA